MIPMYSYLQHCEQTVSRGRHTRRPLKFLSVALLTLELVPVPENEFTIEVQIRDTKDRPILRAAIAAKADILLTGDKDFLESGVEKPAIMTPAEFLQLK